jgi:hypothetical protein
MAHLIPEVIESENWSPTSQADHQAILRELEAIVNSVYFRSSKRYPGFLRYVVQEQLFGRGHELKERTIGIELYGREATYDTNEDPIVRVAAAEVRKRLANYYAEPANARRLKIYLLSGSYVPSFQKPDERTTAGVAPVVGLISASQTIVHADSPTKSLALRDHLWLWTTGLAVMLVIGAFAVIRIRSAEKIVLSYSPPDTLTAFWKPVTDSPSPILTSVGTVSSLHPASSPAEPTPEMGLLEAVHHYNVVPLADAIAMARISSFLGERHSQMRIMNADMTSFDDVRSGPTIFIGGFTNQWTMRLTSKLRFSFEESPTISRIIDHRAKMQPEWIINRNEAYSSLTRDYAVIARYHDATTGRMTIIGAGIGPNGTLAASEFLINGNYLTLLSKAIPQEMNVEAVIGTQVINGKSGPPQILATEFW